MVLARRVLKVSQCRQTEARPDGAAISLMNIMTGTTVRQRLPLHCAMHELSQLDILSLE